LLEQKSVFLSSATEPAAVGCWALSIESSFHSDARFAKLQSVRHTGFGDSSSRCARASSTNAANHPFNISGALSIKIFPIPPITLSARQKITD
jgi:hypothetical protein